jgi:hypothetical protein
MKGYFIVKQFPIVIKPDKRLSQVGQAENDFVKAQVYRIKNRIKGKDYYKYKTWDEQ